MPMLTLKKSQKKSVTNPNNFRIIDMVFKGKYTQKYTLDRESKELVVEVELLQRQGLGKPGENIYYAVATANGQDMKHKDLAHCVNAQYMAETMGLEIIEAWKKRAKKLGNSFRLKRQKK